MTTVPRRVVVTGLGVISALGHDAEAFAAALFAGRGGIGPITRIPTDGLGVRVAAEVRGFDASAHFTKKHVGLLDRFAQFAMVAARQAIAQSAPPFAQGLGTRTATLIGTGAGGLGTQDDNFHKIYAENAKRVHPFIIPRAMASAAASHISMEFGLTGPAYAISSACSSATHAIGEAFHMVRWGRVEAAVAGGSEAPITYGSMKAWEAMRVMSPDICRPFSRDRGGLVLGEGAGVFVLETLEHAARRAAPILAEIAGFGMGADALDIVQPSADGAAQAMRAALDDAGLTADQVDYINAHGTGTASNDATETAAIRAVFGDAAERLAVSSTKGAHGHALGAAGGLELAATILAIGRGFLPPTINYTTPDPACDLDYVPNQARAARIDVALTNSFAFGGLNAVLAIRRVA